MVPVETEYYDLVRTIASIDMEYLIYVRQYSLESELMPTILS